MRKKEKDKSVNLLKRKLIKIGIYSTPIVASISIPDIKIQAQTPAEDPGGGDIPAPPFRKKNIVEEEKSRDKDGKRKRLRLMDDSDKNDDSIFESPFKKSLFKLRKRQEEKDNDVNW